MENKPLVSIIIPVKNSSLVLEECISHINNQTYKNIEIIVVDSNSTDKTLSICKKYEVKAVQFDNKELQGRFDATYKRNLGAKSAKGEFVYYVDADFRLTPRVIEEAVFNCLNKKFDAVIVREVVRGEGFWTACKAMEQECYSGDDNVEAPRFFKKEVWDDLRGLDESLGAGCDDWDLYQRFLKKGYKATRIKSYLFHDEGKITLNKTVKKAYLYGRDVSKFVKKSPKGGFTYFFPIRMAYIRNWKLFLKKPHMGSGIIVIRLLEYTAGALGVISNFIRKK